MLFQKMLLMFICCGFVFGYDVVRRKGPMPGVLINRKVATAKQSLLNRQIAVENGDPNVLPIIDDEICVEMKKNRYVDNKIIDDRYASKNK